MNVLTQPDAVHAASARTVTAILGPTNTGKTHLAIERMLAHPSGMIGLPLRLLAREVYGRVVQRVGADAVALITGEEKIIPAKPRFSVCTVEALPARTDVSFLAIDEIQLAGDLERGHVFTDRILNLRGRDETLLLGAATMRRVIEKLIPGASIVTRPRLSILTYAGQKKITRMQRRSAVVAFSADEVYAIGELIRRQRGGVAVVLGALSPRTRNAQVEMFQNGDVDFLVATDAIGMGLNLDLDHVAFASDRKFDGYQYRRLTPAEFGQIAGRAGRHTRDGTFGVTGRADPLEPDLVEALETHRFAPVQTLQWRNRVLDLSSIAALKTTLDATPNRDGLTKAPPADDVNVLELVTRDPDIAALANARERVALLWDVCQLPDYRRIALANHGELVAAVFSQIARRGAISDDWFAEQIAFADRTDGDIDTLSNRIAHIRTWTYAANRPDWLRDQTHWQERTRAIEDRLSDALHERLTQRFVDRRTSVLMRRLRENAMLEAEITPDGSVVVEGLHVGQLQGFRFVPDPQAGGPDAKAIRTAAQQALVGEISRRAEGVSVAANEAFVLASDGVLRWQGLTIARLVDGDDILTPRLVILADEALTGAALDAVQGRLDKWLKNHLETLLKPLFDMRAAEDLAPLARGIAFRLSEALGVIERSEIAEDVRALDQDMRASLRKLGVRFGAYNIYVPALLKPHPSALLAILWGLKNGGLGGPGLAELPALSAAGRTTIPVDESFPKALYRVVGFRVSGPRAVRLDILERLADLIRPLLSWRPTAESPEPPTGAVRGGGFTITPAMTSLLGSSGDDFAAVLKSLGYRVERRAVHPAAPAVTPAAAPAANAPVDTAAAPEAAADGAAAPEAATDDGASAPEAAADDGASAPEAPASASGQESPEAVGEAPGAAAETPVEAAAIDQPEPSGWAEEEAPAPVEPQASTAEDTVSVAEAAPAEGVPAAMPLEPAFIEVWRPGRPPGDRRHRPGGRDGRPQRNNNADAGAQPQQADGAVATPSGEPGEGRGRDRGGRRGGGPGRDGEERKAGGGRRDGGNRSAGAKPERGREDRPPRRDGEDRRDRPQRSDPERRPFASSQPAFKPREKVADPDSPFAKLAALKADLEKRGR
ncbi:MAG: helicase [Bauldia sp.]|nr:helicase [Bauldia sp.]